MKKDLTIEAIILLHKAIETLKQGKVNRTLAYAMKRTTAATQPIWDAVTEMEKPSPVLEVYIKALQGLIKDVGGITNQNGTATIKPGDMEKFLAGELALKSLHPEAEKEIKEIDEALKSKVKETVEIDLHMADCETLPEEIVGTVYDGLFPMMNEPKEK